MIRQVLRTSSKFFVLTLCLALMATALMTLPGQTLNNSNIKTQAKDKGDADQAQLPVVIYSNSTILTAGGNLTTTREGGDVQLSNGRMLRVMTADQGMPQKERRYVFFLRHNKEGRDYSIITGYKLRRNKVYLLDEVDLERFTIYKNMDEINFLNAVREAVVNPPKAPER